MAGEVVSILADGFQSKTEHETLKIKFADKIVGRHHGHHVRLVLPTTKEKPAPKS